ncbi:MULTISPECIES: hypothetical protein [unclassified Mesorhizobium]|uniref:hypothetical protein n=1 Tax=unclassified Mesorhizobium TaxID=325217 RepID=UPI0015E36F12|nr:MULTISPECIES: hypothetical protein [unclassified Mesorhizobium]
MSVDAGAGILDLSFKALHERLLLGPDDFAPGKRELQSGLGLAALVAADSVPQLGAQFLNVLIDRHVRLLDVGGGRHRRS